MNITDYIGYFAKANRSPELKVRSVEMAKHFFIGLALDLPSVAEARTCLFTSSHHDFETNFGNCGKNIPEVFQAVLENIIANETVPAEVTEENYGMMIGYFKKAVEAFRQQGAVSGSSPSDPLCCHSENRNNSSTPPESTAWCRYVSISTFENYFMFGRLTSGGSGRPLDRKILYNDTWIESCNRDFPSREVNLGRPGELDVHGIRLPVPVFWTPFDEAPHHEQTKAEHVAREMGLPASLQYSDPNNRTNDGVVALKFSHGPEDRFYRPTFLDALAHTAFRPGPTGDMGGFRHGWTRRCEATAGSLVWDNPTILPQKGRKELVMKNRKERFPSEALKIAAILFYS